jgi:hypothetical protein
MSTWLPDGIGLSPLVREIVAERGMTVHLRLTAPDRAAACTACGHGLGEWFSGVASEVTCPACLEAVPRHLEVVPR